MSLNEKYEPKYFVMNSDGTEEFELNKDDYTKKMDGTHSGISDFSFDKNIMIGLSFDIMQNKSLNDGSIKEIRGAT